VELKLTTGALCVSGAGYHLAAARHVAGSQRTGLTSLLHQGTTRAEQMHAEVADRRAFDVLLLADVGAHAALTEETDAWAADEQQRVAEA